MNLKRRLFVGVLGLLLVSCGTSYTATITPIPTPDISVERAVILDAFLQLLPATTVYVVENYVNPFVLSAESYTHTWPTLPDDVLENFLTKNKTTPQWNQVLVDDSQFAFVDSAEYIDVFCCVNMEKLRQDFPGSSGIIWLSRAGFSRDNTQALLDLQLDTDYYISNRYILWLELLDGKWKIKTKSVSQVVH